MSVAIIVGVAVNSFAQAPTATPKPAASSTAKGAPSAAPSSSTATTAPAASASAAASTNSGSGAAPANSAGPSDSAAPATHKSFPPPPPPSQKQVDALQALQTETDAYAVGAKEYRDTITTIVKLHYEEKKKEILSGLDSEIGIEKAELKKAREIAIQRLEEFIAKYSGPNSQPEATPDAMYRLAALYEERARGEDATDDLSVGLKPAIALYKRVINEFPNYKELAGIYYFLGHAYNDSNRTEESQQVWRSLVCHNKYAYPTPPDPKNPDADTIVPLPQDHDEPYWTAWRNAHQDPKSAKRGGPDSKYLEVYPQDCIGVAQPGLRPGEEPKYVAEIWWQIGNWEFDNLDLRGGVVRDEAGAVYDYNRAASAYNQSLKYKKPPLYGVALYKYAWTLFKQQRYQAATQEFVHLLIYTDEQQKLTGDPGADFRSEAYTYIAGSLTNVDFAGPGPEEPFIQRPDIVDTEPNPVVAETKLHIAIDRVKDPQIVPQDKPWTIEIYKALAGEYRSLNQFKNAVEVYDLILKKWPMDPSAPDVQNSIAETYDQMNVTTRPNTPEHDAIAAKALQARTALANYIGNTPWVDANKDNPAAIQNAERLVKGGLRQAAAAHTNNGRALLQQASEDTSNELELLQRALAEYNLAALGWRGYLSQDENAPDAYDSRYWLADARHKALRISVILHKLKPAQFAEPPQKQIDDAKAAAIDVRDSNEDDKYLDNAAFFVVEESDVKRDLEYQRFQDSKGTQGFEERTEVKFDSNGPDKKVVKDTVPDPILQSVQARDDYVARVPPNLDLEKRGLDYEFYAADVFFVYGQFDLARARFEPMYKDHCGTDEYGYKAWEKLISMSNMMRDAERSRQLAEAEKAHSCAVNDAQKSAGGLIINPTLQEAAYVDARKKFEEAKAAPPGPAKDALWKQAAGMYEAALNAAPGRDEAPEAAMNAAYAYKQVGDYNKAIDMYNKFIAAYGSDTTLKTLQNGGADSTGAKVAPDPKRYQERLGFLQTAYDELGATYYGFFNYPQAAATYQKVADNERFPEAKRKETAKNAMILYSNMGQKDQAVHEEQTFLKLHPTADEKANAEFLIANFDFVSWNQNQPDSGANRTTRLSAQSSLAQYFSSHRNNPAASKYSLTAAYQVGKMNKTAGDKQYQSWFKNTIAAYEFFKLHPTANAKGANESTLPPYVDYVGEAEYTLVDDDIKAQYEVAAKHKYSGRIPDVIGDGKKTGKYQANAKDADKFDERLTHVEAYNSLQWTPAARARRGSLYDTLRTGLYNVTAPPLQLFTAAQDTLLKRLEGSGRDDLADQAQDIRDKAKEGWRTKKDAELDGADQLMVKHYATSVAWAQNYNVRNDSVVHAIARLAYFTDIIGDAKLRTYVTATDDPIHKGSKLSYKDGQYVQSRPGISAVPKPSAQAEPLPVAP